MLSYYNESTSAVEVVAFRLIMAEWGRAGLAGTLQEQYQQRVNHLQNPATNPGGLNGAATLSLARLSNDLAAVDSIFGCDGLDWFLISSSDSLKARVENEIQTLI